MSSTISDAPASPASPTGQAGPTAPAAPTVSTASIVATMLQAGKISDLIFSPSRAPQVELNGHLKELNIAGVGRLTPQATLKIALDLMARERFLLSLIEGDRRRVSR